MRYIDEYRNSAMVARLVGEIHRHSIRPARFMEVCGGHTMSIQRFGIPSILPAGIELISGPGCPVCVTDKRFLDRALKLSGQSGVIIATYGDLIRVPGSRSTLERERGKGADIRIVFSALESVKLAISNPDRQIVFLGIGFETTAPATAMAVQQATSISLQNFSLLSSHKVMPPAMKALVDDGVQLNGYICPGHVSTITGTSIYREIVDRYGIGCVISGFEPTDLLETILMLVKQMESGQPALEIQYARAVRPEGNTRALEIMYEVFEPTDEWWRGLGVISQSGLRLRDKYRPLDAAQRFDIEVPDPAPDGGCICGEILKGLKSPLDCPLFAKVCTPADPVGACMVSGEGSCQAYYRYHVEK